jgi:flagellar hook-associated protein 3 FlgL
MRISTNNVMQTTLFDLNIALDRYTSAQNQVSSGKRLTKPSDDPAGMSYSLSLHSVLDTIDQYRSNIGDARAFLSTSDNALSSATDVIRSVRTAVVQASSTQMDDQARIALATQVDGAIQQLAQVANTTYGQRYVFGGQRTTQPPFVASGDTFAYRGGSIATDDGALTVDIGAGQSITINVTGDRVFANAFSTLAKIRDDILGGQTTELSQTDLAQIDAVRSAILTARSELGTKADSLAQTDARLEQSSLQLKDTISKIEDADIPSAVIELQTAQLAYQAALSAASKSLSMNLLDFLR